jgi:hypothetical protein
VTVRDYAGLSVLENKDKESVQMNPHFTLFREAMARPGNVDRHSGGGALIAALVIGVVLAAALIVPMIHG